MTSLTVVGFRSLIFSTTIDIRMFPSSSCCSFPPLLRINSIYRSKNVIFSRYHRYWRGALLPSQFYLSSNLPNVHMQNRGVGLGIIRRLTSLSTPFTLYATSRSGTSSLEGVSSSTPSKLQYVALDISDPGSIRSFAEKVEKEHGKGGVDVLINNAGMNEDPTTGYGQDEAKRTMKTNFWGTKAVSSSFISQGDLCARNSPILVFLCVDVRILLTSAQASNRKNRKCRFGCLSSERQLLFLHH